MNKAITPTNGNTKELPNPKAEVTNASTQTAKVTPITLDPSKDKKPLSDLPPIEDRILKVQQLISLTERHETLKEAQ